MTSWKKKWLYHCTEVRSTEFISKQPCQFFCPIFLFTPVQIQCPTLWTECARYLHSLLIILPIYLLPVICFKLPITRTFFNFPGWFLLSGVGCTLLPWSTYYMYLRFAWNHRHIVVVPFLLPAVDSYVPLSSPIEWPWLYLHVKGET